MAFKTKAAHPLKVEVPKHDLEPLVLQRENTKHKARYPDKGVGYSGLSVVLGTQQPFGLSYVCTLARSSLQVGSL